MLEISKSKLRPSHVHEWLKKFKWPRRVADKTCTGVDAFDKKRADNSWKAGYWRASASECLSLHPVLAHYAREVVLPCGLHNASCEALLALSSLVHIMWSAAKHTVPPAVVRQASENFIAAYRSAFGLDTYIWKMHAVLHFSGYFEKFKWAPHTLPMERKHKLLLRYGTDQSKDTRAIVREVTAKTLNDLRHAPWLDLSSGLVQATRPSKRLQGFLDEHVGAAAHMASRKARFSRHEVAWIGDVVAIVESPWTVAKVLWFASSNDVPFACVRGCTLISKNPWSSVWRPSGDPFLVELKDFMEVLIHTVSGNEITVLHPLTLTNL